MRRKPLGVLVAVRLFVQVFLGSLRMLKIEHCEEILLILGVFWYLECRFKIRCFCKIVCVSFVITYYTFN